MSPVIEWRHGYTWRIQQLGGRLEFKIPKILKVFKWYLKYLIYIEYLNTLTKYFFLVIWYLNTISI